MAIHDVDDARKLRNELNRAANEADKLRNGEPGGQTITGSPNPGESITVRNNPSDNNSVKLTPGIIHCFSGQVRVEGVLRLLNQASDPPAQALRPALYAKDGEVYTKDGSGNVTLQSPHGFRDFEPEDADEYPAEFSHENEYLGARASIDLFKLARLVEGLTGEQLIHVKRFEPKEWDLDEPPPEWLRKRIEARREAGGGAAANPGPSAPERGTPIEGGG